MVIEHIHASPAGISEFDQVGAVAESNASNCRMIEAMVAAVFGIAPDALRAPTRSRANIAFARQVAMYVAHVSFGLSLTEVGRLFGRDRTTAGHACRTVEDRRDDPAFDGMLAAIETATYACRKARDSRRESMN